jgi:hypothetical protein
MRPVELGTTDHCAGEASSNLTLSVMGKAYLGGHEIKRILILTMVTQKTVHDSVDLTQWALVRYSGELLCCYGHGDQPSSSTKVTEFLDQWRNAQGKFRTTERWLLRLQFGPELQSFIMFISIAMVGNTET